jgi:hypothetical protein
MKIIAAAIASLLALASLGCDGATSRCAHVAAPISVAGPRPLTVRTDAGSLWTSAHAWAEPRATWALPAHGEVDEVAIRALPGGGHAITFRQGGLLWQGEVDAERTARGPLRALATPMERDAGLLTTR